MNVSLIIAAAGASRRFLKGKEKKKNRLGKLSLPLGPKPLLAHTLESFRGLPQIREIIMALPRGAEKWVRSEVLNGQVGPRVRLVRGGRTRAESVRNALLKTSPRNDWVLVHDGARPFPPRKMIQELFRRSSKADGIILARSVVPTLKRAVPKTGEIIETVDRSELYEAETPQLVRRSVLLKAYQKNPQALRATDESSLVESVGGKMKVLEHSGWNVKVTTPEDLRLAEAYHLARHCEPSTLLGGRSNLGAWRLLRRPFGPPRNDGEKVRIGFGRDTHRLVTGRKLYLGGIRIPFEKGALGHSDGDALLHAITDALLGAVGAGDIGDWFSDKGPRYRNARSKKFVRAALIEACRRGWRPAQVDSVITLERPKLSSHKRRIRRQVAALLQLPEVCVSIKAKTREGLGPEGKGLAVTCEALVVMERAA